MQGPKLKFSVLGDRLTRIIYEDSVAKHRRLWETTIRALEAMPQASSKRENRVSHSLQAAAGGLVNNAG